ncbi:MAG: peroxide stress protein YaaA [Rhodoferax sp.]
MLFVLSPAKSLDYDTAGPAHTPTAPLFVPQTQELIDTLRPLSVAQVASLMKLSDTLAALNVARYAAWSPQATAQNARAAVLAFDGDVYDGLQARAMDTAQLRWLQKHLCILSGLYGVLRPLDRMQPYRLEMGTALATARGRNLYQFWGDSIAQYLGQRVAQDGQGVLVNLASQEYFKAAHTPALRARVVECVFQDWSAGQYKVLGFYAKRARGMMLRFACEQQVQRAEDLRAFDAAGYAWCAEASSVDRWVFRRKI